MGERISQSEFARRVGRSPSRISQLVTAGVLRVDRRGKLDADAAMAAFVARTAPPADDPTPPAAPAPPPPPAGRPGPPAAAEVAAAQSLAKLAESQVRAKLAQQKLAERTGQLIALADVKADAAAVAEKIRGALLRLPGELAADLPGVPDLEAVASRRINAALAHLHASRYLP